MSNSSDDGGCGTCSEVSGLTRRPRDEDGAWMMKTKTMNKGDRFGASGWKRKFVWLDHGFLCYGVEEYVVEKRSSLSAYRSAERLLPEEAALMEVPKHLVSCCWVVRSGDKVTPFATETEVECISWVERINEIISQSKTNVMNGGDRELRVVNRSASPDGVSPLDPLQPDVRTTSAANGSFMSSEADAFVSRRSSGVSDVGDTGLTIQVDSISRGAALKPFPSLGSFRRGAGGALETPKDQQTQQLARSQSNLSYLNNRSFTAAVVSTPRELNSARGECGDNPLPIQPPSSRPTKFGLEEFKVDLYNADLDACVAGRWIQKGKSGQLKGFGSEEHIGGGGWHQRFMWLDGRKLFYGKERGEKETEFFVDEIIKAQAFKPEEMMALKAPDAFLHSGWCIVTKQGRVVNVASNIPEEVRAWCVVLNYLRPETQAEVSAREQYELQKAAYEEYIEQQRKEREAKLAAEAEARRKKEADAQLRKAMMAMLAAEKAKQIEERARKAEEEKKAEDERKAEEERQRILSQATVVEPVPQQQKRDGDNSKAEAERSCCVIA